MLLQRIKYLKFEIEIYLVDHTISFAVFLDKKNVTDQCPEKYLKMIDKVVKDHIEQHNSGQYVY